MAGKTNQWDLRVERAHTLTDKHHPRVGTCITNYLHLHLIIYASGVYLLISKRTRASVYLARRVHIDLIYI